MRKQMALNRRGFVGVMSLGAASAMVGGCATTSGAGGNMGKVIVVGGGYGGATAAPRRPSTCGCGAMARSRSR